MPAVSLRSLYGPRPPRARPASSASRSSPSLHPPSGPTKRLAGDPTTASTGLRSGGVVQQHAGLPHPRDGVREPHRLCYLGHSQPQRLPRRGLGHPAPAADLALARVHDAALRQQRHDARDPDLGRLLDDEVHPPTLGHRLVQRDLDLRTSGAASSSRTAASLPPRNSAAKSRPAPSTTSTWSPVLAAQDLEDVVGLARRQIQDLRPAPE